MTTSGNSMHIIYPIFKRNCLKWLHICQRPQSSSHRRRRQCQQGFLIQHYIYASGAEIATLSARILTYASDIVSPEEL